MSGVSRARKPVVIEQIRRAQMAELLAQKKRLDGRGLTDYRPIKIETNVIQKANGSAMVSLGNTQVMAGLKIGLGSPFADTPGEGVLIVNAEVLPLASAYTEPGPPDENAIELARVVDRGIRNSEMIDLEKLVVVQGRSVINLYVDVNVLNIDGNLFDAASYAAVAALVTAKIPVYRVKEDGMPEDSGELTSVPQDTIPVSVTMARIGDTIVVDPDSEEEAVMDARLTLVYDGRGNLCAGQKGQGGSFAPEQIAYAAQLTKRKGEELHSLLKEEVSAGG